MPDPAGLNKSGNLTTQSVKKLDEASWILNLLREKKL